MSSTTADAAVRSQTAAATERRGDFLSLVPARLKRRRSGAAIVFHGERRPRADDIVGVITKRAIADAVIDNYED
ncbi:MAG TPA: hypothetical protein VJY34_15810 [Roseiarcus sp.]|nr:hypothetical protein [Roseiarcus sp.]